MFRFYPLLLSGIQDNMRKHAGAFYKSVKKDYKRESEHVRMFGELYSAVRNIEDGITDRILADEIRWLNSDRKSLFVPDVKLLESLSQTKFDQIQDITLIAPPFDSFILALPKNYTVSGKKISGVMVNSFESFDEVNENAVASFRQMGFTYNFPSYSRGRAGPYLTLNYVVDGDQNHSGLLAPVSHLHDFLRGGDINTENATVGVINPFNDNEIELQSELVRMILSVFIYISAFGSDEVVQDGLPKGLASIKKVRGTEHALQKGAIWLKNSTRSSEGDRPKGSSKPKAPHFRQLMHERFYRGEYENYARGSRVIYVLGKNKPSHVVDKITG